MTFAHTATSFIRIPLNFFFVASVLLVSSHTIVAQETNEASSASAQSTNAVAKAQTNIDTKAANQNDLAARAPISAQDWLVRLSKQVRALNYEISFVQTRPNKEALPYLWRHAVINSDISIEQLSLLNGPGFEQIRYNDMVSIFEPGYPPYSTAANAIDGPIPWMLLYQPNSLSSAYEFVLVGRSRVSGRAAQQIRVISRDKTRFDYHIWLDEDSGLLLKLNMYDIDGQLLEQIQVTQMRIDDKVAESFASLQVSNLPKVVTMQEPPQREHKWRVSFMPTGMQRIKQDVHRLAITGQIVEYSLLSDGLVDVSVYIQPASDVFQEDVVLRSDSNTVLSRTNGRVQVTIVGEIPTQTADRIANSIVLVD